MPHLVYRGGGESREESENGENREGDAGGGVVVCGDGGVGGGWSAAWCSAKLEAGAAPMSRRYISSASAA